MHNRICVVKLDVFVQPSCSRTFQRKYCTIKSKDVKRDELKTSLSNISQNLGYSSIADWYKISTSQIRSNPKLNLLTKSDSLLNILKTAYPQQTWIPWKFEHLKCPSGFWKEVHNHRLFFDWLGNELGAKELDDWYSILSYELVKFHGGTKLLSHYNNSAIHALQAAYPDHPWCTWKFKNVHKGLWSDINTQKEFMEWLGKELGVKELDDWYQHASVANFVKYGRSGLLSIHKGSPYLLMKSIYPHHNWLAWKFYPMPKDYWANPTNQRAFIDWAAQKLNIVNMDNWYEVTSDQISSIGGQSLLRYHRYSVFRILQTVYPQHNWKPWKFPLLPKVTWEPYMPALIEELSKQLQIQQLEDWYRVSTEQLQERSAHTAIQQSGGLFKVLSKLYPEHPWNEDKFKNPRKKAAQRWLFLTVQELFPNTEVYEDYKIHESTVGASRYPFELDVFVPALSLAFEYQGEQHYRYIGLFSPHHVNQERDIQKRDYCQKLNITLVEVPYWWNKQKASLAGIITTLRSDVHLPQDAIGKPIPTRPM